AYAARALRDALDVRPQGGKLTPQHGLVGAQLHGLSDQGIALPHEAVGTGLVPAVVGDHVLKARELVALGAGVLRLLAGKPRAAATDLAEEGRLATEGALETVVLGLHGDPSCPAAAQPANQPRSQCSRSRARGSG